ncbi:MAG: hypothetical protein OCD01_18855 [Fibrobacterales bacterium]
MKVRALGITAVLLVGTTYSTYRIWKARKSIKEYLNTNLLQDYKAALEKLTYDERRAYRMITGFFENSWKTSLRGISCKAILKNDLYFDHLTRNKQITFVDSLESEFSVDLPNTEEIGKLSIRDLVMLCAHETEEDHNGFE